MSEDYEAWFCEGCNDKHTNEPTTILKYPAHEGETELWFCEDCQQDESF